jgi:succinyl-CoA synthetase beta subunit
MMNVIEQALKQGRNTLSEYESKELLQAYGIHVTREAVVKDESALKAAARTIGYPMVLKGCSPKLSHKTERGMVHLDVRNEAEALQAFQHIMENMDDPDGAALVQELVRGGRELVVGLTRDIQFGPCIMFGLGGIFTEILEDTVFRVAPIEKVDALEMMKEIRGRKILEAVRGMPAANLEKLAEILITVGRIGLENEAIQEIDMNPVVLSGSDPVVVDALVVLKAP